MGAYTLLVEFQMVIQSLKKTLNLLCHWNGNHVEPIRIYKIWSGDGPAYQYPFIGPSRYA